MTEGPIALFAGSFDPPTTGHEAVLEQACRVFPKVLVALAEKPGRLALFSRAERMALLEALVSGFPNAELVSYHGLTADFARKRNVAVLVRGLRDVGDLPYERELAVGNAALAGGLPTCFFLGGTGSTGVSGRLVREVIQTAGLEAALPFIPESCKEVIQRIKGIAKGGEDLSGGEKRSVPKAIGPYSIAVRAGEFLFVSGQIPVSPETGKIVEGGIEEQTRQCIENLIAVLENESLGLDSVVKTTVFLVDIADFGGMNKEYARFFGNVKPARSTVQVAALPAGARIEIEAVAWAGKEA